MKTMHATLSLSTWLPLCCVLLFAGCASGGGTRMCGNAWLDSGEDCDTVDLAGQTCAGLGFGGGTLACSADCTFDTSACLTATCGDGVAEGSEACDGADLSGNTCVSAGFGGGYLACTPGCALDVSGCFTTTCGNNVINAPEVCDGADLAGNTCGGLGFDVGTLACSADCESFDTSGCATCGDNVRQGAEVCDGLDLASSTCMSLGFTSGTLACSAGCEAFDTSGCATCGDGVRAGAEVCDGGDLAGATCAAMGFAGGSLACSTGCGSYDTAGCTTCAGTILVANWNGFAYWKVPVVGAMSDAGLAAACAACAMTVPCSGPTDCMYNDGACLQTHNETSCGNPMLDLASRLCGASPPDCAALFGIYQYMGYTWIEGSACGVESGEWCAIGNNMSNRFALCVAAAK